MFVEFFDWLCNSLTSVFDVMKRFVLFEGFTYYHFCIGILVFAILYKILKFILGIEDEEPSFGQPQPNGNYKPQYDSNSWNKYNNRPITYYSWYKPKHRALYRSEYEPRHETKGRHGK